MCLECLRCADFFSDLFRHRFFYWGIFSIFHKNVGNSVLPINVQKIVERLFIAGIESGLKCLNQCNNPPSNMSKKDGRRYWFSGSKRHISAIYERISIGFGA